MRVLFFDGGAKRLGWASVERTEAGLPAYHISGILDLDKPEGEAFQAYRLRLTEELTNSIPALVELTQPDEIVTETLPPVGFNNSVQSYLVNVALTVVHVVALQRGLPLSQIGATTIQSRIAIGRKGRKTTKAQVRNGVIQLLPELSDRKSQWVKVFDEPDAIAGALTHLGFRNTR